MQNQTGDMSVFLILEEATKQYDEYVRLSRLAEMAFFGQQQPAASSFQAGALPSTPIINIKEVATHARLEQLTGSIIQTTK